VILLKYFKEDKTRHLIITILNLLYYLVPGRGTCRRGGFTVNCWICAIGTRKKKPHGTISHTLVSMNVFWYILYSAVIAMKMKPHGTVSLSQVNNRWFGVRDK
jgi:hypothetical protein